MSQLSWTFWTAVLIGALLIVLLKSVISNHEVEFKSESTVAEKEYRDHVQHQQVRFRRPSAAAQRDFRDLYRLWRKCIDPLMQPLMNDSKKFWEIIHEVGNKCGDPLMRELNVQELKNTEEIKYYIPQKENYRDAVVVSLGIGHDIVTELKLKQGLDNVGIEFFGADPIVEVNKKLYETIGAFFPFAVTANTGSDVATVLEESGYSDKRVITLEAIYFFKNYIRRNLIDLLILDVEGSEYGLFPYLKKDGLFDKNNITFCQINMEIHRPDAEKKEQILDLFKNILNEEKYVVVGFVKITFFLRIYLVNVSDPACVSKYLPITNGK